MPHNVHSHVFQLQLTKLQHKSEGIPHPPKNNIYINNNYNNIKVISCDYVGTLALQVSVSAFGDHNICFSSICEPRNEFRAKVSHFRKKTLIH